MQKFFDFYNSEHLSQWPSINEEFIQDIFFNANEEFCIRFLKWAECLPKFNGIFR